MYIRIYACLHDMSCNVTNQHMEAVIVWLPLSKRVSYIIFLCKYVPYLIICMKRMNAMHTCM